MSAIKYIAVVLLLGYSAFALSDPVQLRLVWIQNNNDKHIVYCNKDSFQQFVKKAETGPAVSIAEFSFQDLADGETANCYVEGYLGADGPATSAVASVTYTAPVPAQVPIVETFEVLP